jgi:formamidopyrimidine-DNA glycosylase
MGPEPLGNGFHGQALFAALQKRKSPVKAALLDQGVVAGVGNIYACEALFMASVSPLRAACDVSADECEALARAVRDVLAQAIEAGGSSLRDYRNTKGDLGYFQHHFRVYDRAGHVCPQCEQSGTQAPLVRRVVQSGRSSFYCAQCQS